MRSHGAVPSGFHTERWARAYAASATEVLGQRPDGSRTQRRSGPTPPRSPRWLRRPTARRAAVELDELVGDRKLVLRSDRIDLSKNIVRGFLVYDQLLATHPEWRDRVVFVAMLNRSRESLAEYLAYEQEVDQAAARVNDRWGTDDWQPVVVDTRDDYEQTIAGFTRYDVLLVNPVKDGLNLVAKEGPLLNRRDGVVLLSPEAGAYDELADAALAIHPYDIEQGAHALHTALSMPDDERAARATRLCELAELHTPQSWLRELLNQARAERVAEGVQHFRQARRTVDHDVGPVHLGRALGRRHADAHAVAEYTVAFERVQRREGGEVAGVVPRERGHRCAAGEVGDGGALVDGNRRPQLDRHPSPQRSLEPQARRRLVGPCHRLGPPVGLGAPVDGDGHTPLALHQQPGQCLVGLVGGARDRAHPGPDAVVDHHLAVDDPFEAVGADVAQPVDVERIPQERGGSAAHHDHRPQHRHEPGQRGAGRGEHRGRAGVVDDRREQNRRSRRRTRWRRDRRRTVAARAAGPRRFPLRWLRRADDHEAVGLRRAHGRIGGIRLHLRAVRHPVQREQGALTVEPLEALDHGAGALAAQVRGRLHVVPGALELVGQDLGPALHP